MGDKSSKLKRSYRKLPKINLSELSSNLRREQAKKTQQIKKIDQPK